MGIAECNMLFVYGVFVEAAASEGRRRDRRREHHLDARRNPTMDVIVINEVQSARNNNHQFDRGPNHHNLLRIVGMFKYWE